MKVILMEFNKNFSKWFYFLLSQRETNCKSIAIMRPFLCSFFFNKRVKGFVWISFSLRRLTLKRREGVKNTVNLLNKPKSMQINKFHFVEVVTWANFILILNVLLFNRLRVDGKFHPCRISHQQRERHQVLMTRWPLRFLVPWTIECIPSSCFSIVHWDP